MSFKKIQAVRQFETTNKGYWLGAKIYSDVKGGCDCGGKFTGKSLIRRRKGDISYPVCALCSMPPEFFRIWASVLTEDGTKKDVFIRHAPLTGDRLSEIAQCLSILDQVESDRLAGCFDVRKYESKKVKDLFLFRNIVPEYLEYHRKRFLRKEITQNGFDAKVKYSGYLLPYFGEKDVSKINKNLVYKYRDSFIDTFSKRDMSMGELKTILNYCFDQGYVKQKPSFEVKSTEKRKEVPNLKVTRDQIIPAIKNLMKREAIRMLDDYGLRPCEVRAIQYEQINRATKRIVIDRHFSKRTMTPGRKSAKESILDRPITKELWAYIESKPWPFDGKTFLFTTSTGTALGPQDLSEAWAEAEASVGVRHIQMYGLRGARTTEVFEKSGNNPIAAQHFAGHANPEMTMKRYNYSSVNVDEFIDSEMA